MKNRAFYWYRVHPLLEPFYTGQVLQTLKDARTVICYLPESSERTLVSKYFPSGLTPHGLSMLVPRDSSASDVNEPIVDLIFELVREHYYPEAPSRLTSLYASATKENAELWQHLWIKNFGDKAGQIAKELWEIEFDAKPLEVDATFLNIDVKDKFSYLQALDSAHRYWQGEFSETPLPELLVPLPVVVGKSVRDIVAE